MKHTPAPWKITYTRDAKMALVNAGYVCSIELDDNPQGEANARLIAAAPELLEALESAYVELQTLVQKEVNVGLFSLAIKTDAMRAAFRNQICKATGRDYKSYQEEIESIAFKKAMS